MQTGELGGAVAMVIADWDGHHGWDDGCWIVMGIGMIVFWALVILGIVWAVRTLSSGQGSAASNRPEPTAIEVLERRLAEGEISVEEYEQRRDVLTRDASKAS
ncbi:SHOCT domain-containing protein [Thermoleophilum album]|uniref:Putative membrane protein n=1 Tax=Thermoleophilum album TaxID=29539 RepID=A0A1H6G0R3_THEAL|nr:SHOCT domain-containing protein [Thermoleophilum album]SEH16180.1 putative membrane protein [Thermoleophilum album]